MIAYDSRLLGNIAIVKKAKQWFSNGLISNEQMNTILKQYPVKFYSPNLFVKIGLFIFTWIAISAALGMYSSMFFSLYTNSEKAFPVFTCILFSAACIFVLGLFIREKKVYRSGVDECLLYTALGFLFSGIGIMINAFDEQNNFLLLNILAVPFLVAAIVRYSDGFISFVLALCLYTIFFLLLLKLGDIAKMIMPFALMIVSVPLYLTVKKQKQREQLFYWKHCLVVFECVALIVFYLACNYFVIRESSIAFFDMVLNPGDDIPLAFVFYILTAAVPLIYVFYGLKKKDKILLWIGLLLIVISALTFRNYFSLGHPEIALTGAGTIMILIAYFSIRYLKTPKHGITFKEEPDEDNFLRSNAEALLMAQTFGQAAQQPNSTEFGGGQFGGGGAGGTF